jgi:hypothetical protein
MSDTFPIQTGLIEGNALSPINFSFPVKKMLLGRHKNIGGFEIQWTHELVVYADELIYCAKQYTA